MRIGLSCSTIEPALTQGKIDGIGVYTKTLFDEYKKLNHEVMPFSFPTFKNWLKQSAFPRGNIFPLPYTAATIASLIPFVAPSLYKKFDFQMDILHITDHMIPRISSTQVVATIHDALMFSHPEWYPSKTRVLKNLLRKQTFRWAQHFITVSHAMVKELVEFMGIPEKKISVVHNGIAPRWFDKVSDHEKALTLKKLSLPPQFLLFTGTIQPKKNVINIIKAFQTLPKELREQYPLVIVGKAGWGADDIIQTINQLTANHEGYWLNYIEQEDLRVLYQVATLYLCPSLHEGFGYTLVEAFASGTPAITSNTTALPEVAGDAAYLVDPLSTSEIASAIQKLLGDGNLRAELISRGKTRAQEFTLDKCARETLKVYQKI